MIMDEKLKRSRTSYNKKLRMQLQCRVCLTQSNNVMFDLKDELELDVGTKLSYLEALQRITSSKIRSCEFYPSSICPVCASLLKIALRFIVQFKSTDSKLKEIFDNSCDESENVITREESEETSTKPSVELIYKNKKFDVQEVVVIEEDAPKTHDFRGFLNNLGTEVTATFANGQKLNKNCESEDTNVVSIEVGENVQIDSSFNQLEFVIEDSDFLIDSDINLISENNCAENESKFECDEDNVEPDSLKDVINSFIIDKSKKVNEENWSGNGDSAVEKARAESFQCEICDIVYDSKRKLSIHKSRVHFTKTRTFTCEICGIVCRSTSAFVNHKLKHSEKRHKCDQCNKSYFTKNLLKIHKEVHADRRKHQCRTCGAGFNYPNALLYHSRLHTSEKKYKCEFCHKSFRTSGASIRHRRTHTDERPYECRYCERKFRSHGEAKNHELTHTGLRPYRCSVCRKSFAKSYNMRVHMLSHDGPHSCPECDKGLVSESLMLLHVKTAHAQNDLEVERGVLGVDEGGLEVEMGDLEVEQDVLEVERDVLEVEQSVLGVNEDGLEVDMGCLEGEQDVLGADKDGLEVEQGDLKVVREDLEVERDVLEVGQGDVGVDEGCLEVEQGVLEVEQDSFEGNQNNIEIEYEVGVDLDVDLDDFEVDQNGIEIEQDSLGVEQNDLRIGRVNRNDLEVDQVDSGVDRNGLEVDPGDLESVREDLEVENGDLGVVFFVEDLNLEGESIY